MVKLSSFEKELLEALKGVATVNTLVGSTTTFGRKHPEKQANNLYQSLDNIRRKFRKAQAFVGLIHAYRGQGPVLNARLTIKVAQKEPDQGEEE